MLKNEVLKILLTNKSHISGQDISNRLNVSRTAVWKAISSLKKEGYVIESVNNRGYLLLHNNDVLNQVEINQNMSVYKEFNIPKIICLNSVDSTNIYAKSISDSIPEDFLVVSDMQTLGKGRRGRSWASPPGVGIWMSLCIRPRIKIENASMITLIMALSVCDALESLYSLKCNIKWPNDIVINSKKISGILTEMSSDIDGIRYIISGVGINANNTDFPEDIRDTATSLYLESGIYINRTKLIAEIIYYFYRNLSIFLNTEDMSALKSKYENYLVNIGKIVKILDPEGSYTAKAIGIDNNGALLVEKENEIIRIISGEVSVRGLYGYT